MGSWAPIPGAPGGNLGRISPRARARSQKCAPKARAGLGRELLWFRTPRLAPGTPGDAVGELRPSTSPSRRRSDASERAGRPCRRLPGTPQHSRRRGVTERRRVAGPRTNRPPFRSRMSCPTRGQRKCDRHAQLPKLQGDHPRPAGSRTARVDLPKVPCKIECHDRRASRKRHAECSAVRAFGSARLAASLDITSRPRRRIRSRRHRGRPGNRPTTAPYRRPDDAGSLSRRGHSSPANLLR